MTHTSIGDTLFPDARTRVRVSALGATWIHNEERAYDIPLKRSPRRGRVRFPDGKLRLVRLGIADTYSTIPARGHYKGHTVSGFVYVSDNEYKMGITGKHRTGEYER